MEGAALAISLVALAATAFGIWLQWSMVLKSILNPRESDQPSPPAS
jgi:hypothetical protein